MLAKGMAGVAAVSHNPERHTREGGEKRDGVGQLVRSARCEGEGDGAARTVGDHADLGTEATTG